MMSKSNTRLQNMLRQRKYYEKHREEVNAKRRANYSRSQFMDREGNEGQEREPVVLEASIVPPQQSNLIPPPPPRTDTVELGTECIRLLHLCTFKTPTSSAVMSEQGVNGCALLMRNCLKEPVKKAHYAENKKQGVELVKRICPQDHLEFFLSHKKKDDLADCFLQGVWFVKVKNK